MSACERPAVQALQHAIYQEQRNAEKNEADLEHNAREQRRLVQHEQSLLQSAQRINEYINDYEEAIVSLGGTVQ